MQVIQTKVLQLTNKTPARVKATHTGNSLSATVEINPSEDTNFHIEAARLLKKKLGWEGTMIGGNTKEGMVFVPVESEDLI